MKCHLKRRLANEMPPEEATRKLAQELVNFDSDLGNKPRWLVFTKIDILDQAEAEAIASRAVKELNWTAPWFMISSVTQTGTDELVQSIGRALDEMKELELDQQNQQQWDPLPEIDS